MNTTMNVARFTIAYWCVLIAALLPFVCVFLAKKTGFGKRRKDGGYDESTLAPDRYGFDDVTGLAVWDMRKVRAWQEQRPGEGNWTAIRAAAARRAQAAQTDGAPADGEPAGDLVATG